MCRANIMYYKGYEYQEFTSINQYTTVIISAAVYCITNVDAVCIILCEMHVMRTCTRQEF